MVKKKKKSVNFNPKKIKDVFGNIVLIILFVFSKNTYK